MYSTTSSPTIIVTKSTEEPFHSDPIEAGDMWDQERNYHKINVTLYNVSTGGSNKKGTSHH